jgi:hypothetical protein
MLLPLLLRPRTWFCCEASSRLRCKSRREPGPLESEDKNADEDEDDSADVEKDDDDDDDVDDGNFAAALASNFRRDDRRGGETSPSDLVFDTSKPNVANETNDVIERAMDRFSFL